MTKRRNYLNQTRELHQNWKKAHHGTNSTKMIVKTEADFSRRSYLSHMTKDYAQRLDF